MRRRAALDRFLDKVEATLLCWHWRGALSSQGYGVFYLSRGRYCLAHRFSYETFVGPIPLGLVLDHLCRDRACVNPEHVEPVTNAENIRRGARDRTEAA